MAAPRGRGRRAAARLPREPGPASRPRPRRARRRCFLRRRRRALFHLRECQGAAGGDRVLVLCAPLADRARLFRPLCSGGSAVAPRRHPPHAHCRGGIRAALGHADRLFRLFDRRHARIPHFALPPARLGAAALRQGAAGSQRADRKGGRVLSVLVAPDPGDPVLRHQPGHGADAAPRPDFLLGKPARHARRYPGLRECRDPAGENRCAGGHSFVAADRSFPAARVFPAARKKSRRRRQRAARVRALEAAAEVRPQPGGDRRRLGRTGRGLYRGHGAGQGHAGGEASHGRRLSKHGLRAVEGLHQVGARPVTDQKGRRVRLEECHRGGRFCPRHGTRAARHQGSRAARLGGALYGARRRMPSRRGAHFFSLDGGNQHRKRGPDAQHASHRDRRRRAALRPADPRHGRDPRAHLGQRVGIARAAAAAGGPRRRASRLRAGAGVRAAGRRGDAGRNAAAHPAARGPRGSAMVEESFREEGIDVLVNNKAKQVLVEDGRKLLIAEHAGVDTRIEFDELLCAVGRIANTAGYGLEELGIPVSRARTVETNEWLQTLYPNIYACGDVAGPYQFTHTASHQAWYAAVNALFGSFRKFRADYSAIPWATFTDPEVARVGLNETEAKEQNVPHEVSVFGIDELDRAIADGVARGLVKVLTVPGKDRILGATLVGEHAGDLIVEFITAMKHGLGLNKMLGTIHIYPTLAEANKYAAGVWRKAHAPEALLRQVERLHAWMRG